MKHIKPYKIFESTISEISEYVKDIFAYAEEIDVFVERDAIRRGYNITISHNDNDKFKYSDVINEIEHMKSYFINEENMRLGRVDVITDTSVFDTGNYNYCPINLYGGDTFGWKRLKFLEDKKDSTQPNFICEIIITFETH